MGRTVRCPRSRSFHFPMRALCSAPAELTSPPLSSCPRAWLTWAPKARQTPKALAALRKLRREKLSSSISLIPPPLTVPIDRPINFLPMPKQLSRRAFVKPFSTLIIVVLVFWKGPLTEEGLVEKKDVQGDDQRNDHRSQRGSQAMVG